MVCQGNLLSFNVSEFKLLSNTLQAIAVGYLIASLVFLHFSWRIQLGIAAGLLLIYGGS